MSKLSFTIEATCAGTRARVGRLQLPHRQGAIETPLFMPAATQATVKAQSFDAIRESGARILLANAYHLLLRPGEDVFRRFQGIHRFMGWEGGVLTDSGGYQIFSLASARCMEEEGARFESYLDGREIFLTPERSMQVQHHIGSDIRMALDECVPGDAVFETARAAMERTHRWAKRSLEERARLASGALFGIVQGACHEALRRESAAVIADLPFDGLAIGGLAVGEPKAAREDMTELVTGLLPSGRPRYLMGVGTPIDLLEAVHRGVDLFDCVLPTGWAQRGVAFTGDGKRQLRRQAYRLDEAPLEENCRCRACRGFSRAYLHHLIKAGEVLGWQLLGEHNLAFYARLMSEARAAVRAGEFLAFYRARRARLAMTDGEGPRPRRKARTPSLRRGKYEIAISCGGVPTLKHLPSGELMHSVNVPAEEAHALYVEQPDLARRFREAARPLVIWDVGLGMAQNACAVLAEAEKLASRGGAFPGLELVSFENDLDAILLACEGRERFPHLRHPAVDGVLQLREWRNSGDSIRWRLFAGDFIAEMGSAPRPDVILYDPFSPKVDSQLWSEACFTAVRVRCADGDTELFTYSRSSAVRRALSAAGFQVARGRPSGPKEETTLALTEAAWERRMRDKIETRLIRPAQR